MTTRSLGSLLRDSPRRLASLLDPLPVASTSGRPPESPTTRISCSRIYQRGFSTVVRGEGGDFRSDYDVCVVGAGPAGLAAAIRLKQLAHDHRLPVSVCVLEKARNIGAHTLSGAVIDPRGLDELFPAANEGKSWRTDPQLMGDILTHVTRDRFEFLTGHRAIPLPIPKVLDNQGHVVGSLSGVVRWMGDQAIDLGVHLLPGAAAAKLSLSLSGAVRGVVMGEAGVATDGSRKPGYRAPIEIRSRATLLAEGVRGSLSQQALARYALRQANGAQPMTYALGIKEVWQLPKGDPRREDAGLVRHTLGFPLFSSGTYGGGFQYHLPQGRIAVGLVHALDYRNPFQSPYQEFQRWKDHPSIRPWLEGATCIEYGARALNEGGAQSIPHLAFPGGCLIGCAAGFYNVGNIKGVHTAIKSGMVAAETTFAQLMAEREREILTKVKMTSPSTSPSTSTSTSTSLRRRGETSSETFSSPLSSSPLGDPALPPSPPSPPSPPTYPSSIPLPDISVYPASPTKPDHDPWSWLTLGGITQNLTAPRAPPKTHTARGGVDRVVFQQVSESFLDLEGYDRAVRQSWVWEELWAARNIRPGFNKFGYLMGMAHAALESYLLRGRVHYTFYHGRRDYQLDHFKRHVRPAYPKPDQIVTFDIPTSLQRAHISYEPDQPNHLELQVDRAYHASLNWTKYRGPETRYCPAGVFEYVDVKHLPQGDSDSTIDGGPSMPLTPYDVAAGYGSKQARSTRVAAAFMVSNYPQDVHRLQTRALKTQYEREVEASEHGEPVASRVVAIHAHKCLHCKACDIKDPHQNIRWVPPEGGSGPQYQTS